MNFITNQEALMGLINAVTELQIASIAETDDVWEALERLTFPPLGARDA